MKINGCNNINLYAKLEYYNPTGSIKDKAEDYALKCLLKEKIINRDTLIIESSSGNYGIALATKCKELGLRFCCIIDSHINSINEALLKNYSQLF